MALVQVCEASPPRERLMMAVEVRRLETMSLTAQSKPARMMEVVLRRPSKTLTEMMLV